MEIIEELLAKVKEEPDQWEERVQEIANDLAQRIGVMLLERLDEQLMEGRSKRLRMVGLRERWITTLFGDIRIKRRVYRDKERKYRCLMDEALGLRKNCQSSAKVQTLAMYLSTHLPFGKCEEVMKALIPGGISHNTIHRLVGKTVDRYIEEEAKEVAEVFQNGVIPKTEGRVVPFLMVEGDGVNISLQRERERKGEIKVAIAYEGWEAIGENRYRLKEKTSYTGMMGGWELWESFSVLLAKRYELEKVGQVIVGGDGAGWVKEGVEMLGGIYQLDRFHLLRALRRGLREDQVLPVYEACVAGNIAKADELLRQAQALAEGEAAKHIAKLRGYILNNAEGLRDYRLEVGYQHGLRGLGTIESNIDKLVASRMKKRGMSWTKSGGDRMARLINLRERGELHLWAKNDHQTKVHTNTSARFRLRLENDKPTEDKYRTWIEAGVPALNGPHCNRPWVQTLAAITKGV